MKALVTIMDSISFIMMLCPPEGLGIQWLIPISGAMVFAICGKIYERKYLTKEEREEKVCVSISIQNPREETTILRKSIKRL